MTEEGAAEEEKEEEEGDRSRGKGKDKGGAGRGRGTWKEERVKEAIVEFFDGFGCGWRKSGRLESSGEKGREWGQMARLFFRMLVGEVRE